MREKIIAVFILKDGPQDVLPICIHPFWYLFIAPLAKYSSYIRSQLPVTRKHGSAISAWGTAFRTRHIWRWDHWTSLSAFGRTRVLTTLYACIFKTWVSDCAWRHRAIRSLCKCFSLCKPYLVRLYSIYINLRTVHFLFFNRRRVLGPFRWLNRLFYTRSLFPVRCKHRWKYKIICITDWDGDSWNFMWLFVRRRWLCHMAIRFEFAPPFVVAIVHALTSLFPKWRHMY